MGRLDNKVAIVTGAASGNGFGITEVFMREGATVAMFDFSDQVFDSAAQFGEKGGAVTAYKVDITDAKAVKKAVDEVVTKFGRIDALVNNAGIGIVKLFIDTTDEERDRQVFTNVYGNWNMCKAVVPYMIEKKYGKIVNIGSISGNVACDPGLSTYAITKGGITGFTKGLACELLQYNINVNAIHPGICNTTIWDKEAKKAGIPVEELKADLVKDIPVKRMAEPTDIGALAAFLSSDDAAYIHGTEIVIDGALTLYETSGAQSAGLE